MRKIADCRDMPSESGCSLTISGEEDEVVRVAATHAADVHSHEDTQELRDAIRGGLEDEAPAGRYGTVLIATLNGSVEELVAASTAWAEERHVDGFLGEEVLRADDGGTVVVTVFFRSKADYVALSDDPEQDRWWNEKMAPHLTDVRWIDGTWQARVSKAVPRQRSST